MRRLRHILQSRYLFKILTIILLVLDIGYTKLYRFTSKYDKDDNIFTGIIYDKKIEDDKITLYIKGLEKLIVIYEKDNLEIENIEYGDKIIVKGVLEKPQVNSIPNTFNYKEYLYNKRIYYIVRATSINKISYNHNYLYTIKNIIEKKADTLKSSKYIKTLLIGDNRIDKDVMKSYRDNGISHLFSISGMHISFYVFLLSFYLDKVTYYKKIKYVIADIFLLLYLCIAYSSSLLRSVIMYLLFSINLILKLKIKKIDIMFLTLILAMVINPFIIYDSSFIYSYLISFFLIVFSTKGDSKVRKIVKTALISFIVSFPITIYYNYEINFISLFLNILFVPIFSVILLPLVILTIIFPIFDEILFLVIKVLENISLFMAKIDFFKISFGKVSIIFIIFYYVLIILLFKKRRKREGYILLVMILLHYFIPYINSDFKFVMFNVGQGDSMLISYPHNKGNILVDTGYGSQIEGGIIPYLKSIGIKKIDYLIITHGDSDHIGGAFSLADNFEVEKVILNRGEFNDKEKELMKKVSIYKEDTIRIGKYNLYLLNRRYFDNENDNSAITYFEYLKYRFLLMGDASFVTEDYLLNKYNLHDISFLKVGHHGSSTSTSIDFIDKINPKVSLISVGKNNSYGHPNREVIENLESSKIYRTDIDGTIQIILNRKGCKIRKYMQD